MRTVIIALVLAATTAHAQPDPRADTTTIRTREGDSYGLLAAEYYGDRRHALFILLENNIKQPKPLRPGTRLRIPIAREIVTAPKDSFATLADAYLGDARRGPDLAELNHMNPDESPAAGTVLVIPFVVAYTAQGAESLDAIAATYLGSATHADLLRRYNFLDPGAELDKGKSILVPAFHVKTQAGKLRPPDEKAKERRATRDAVSKRAADALPRARHAWRIGELATVKAELADLDIDYLPVAMAIEAGVLLGSAHVGFGEEAAAKAAFDRVLDRKPSHQLRAFEHSPKVLAVWKQAVGEAQ